MAIELNITSKVTQIINTYVIQGRSNQDLSKKIFQKIKDIDQNLFEYELVQILI